jgi:dimethylsulfoniopropionate demethylase
MRVERDPVRQIRSLDVQGKPVPPCVTPWMMHVNGRPVGQLTSCTWSPDFKTNVGIGMVKMTHWDEGTEIVVETPDGPRDVIVREAAFI